MKRFEAVPLTKLLLVYTFASTAPVIAFYVGSENYSWMYLIPLLLVITFSFLLLGLWSRIHTAQGLRKLEKALETTQVGVTITDIEGKIIYLNSAEAHMHGYQPEELDGKNVHIFAPPEIWEVNPPDLIREMSSWKRESENLRKDGTPFPVRLISDVIRDGNGDPIGIVTVCEDITQSKKAELQLRDSELKFRSVAESATDAMILLEQDLHMIFWNRSAQHIFEYSAHEVLDRPFSFLIPRRYQDELRDAFQSLSDAKPDSKPAGRILEVYGVRKNGDEFPLELCLGTWTTEKGTFFSAMIRDITDRKRVQEELRLHQSRLEELVRTRTAELAESNRKLQIEIIERRQIEEELRKSEERYELAVQGGKEGLWDWNLETNEIFYSVPWKSMIGFADSEISNRPEEWLNRVHPDDLQRLNSEFAAHLEGNTDHFECEHRVMQKDGNYVWVLSHGAAVRDHEGKPIRVAGIQRDVHTRKLLEADWKQRAYCDPLTSLPNRVLFMERLDQALHRMQRQRESLVAVLYVDLDYFKNINDTYGHRIGDQVLVYVSRKLKGCVRPSDTIARIGGDEFVILLEDLKSQEEAVRVADRICLELAEPLYLEGFHIQISASVGIAVSADNTGNGELLLNNADLAMYLAKDQGRARHEMFQSRKPF